MSVDGVASWCDPAMALVVMRERPGRPGIIGKDGWVRSNAWIWVFSSKQNTAALRGGFRYNANDIDKPGLEARIVRQLERGTTPRPQSALAPQLPHDVLADTLARPKRSCGPAIGLVARHRVERVVHDGFDHVRADHRFAAPARTDLAKRVDAARMNKSRHCLTVVIVGPYSRATTRIDCPSASAKTTFAWRTLEPVPSATEQSVKAQRADHSTSRA